MFITTTAVLWVPKCVASELLTMLDILRDGDTDVGFSIIKLVAFYAKSLDDGVLYNMLRG